jgi:preprotein translocase subunit YajC
METLFVIVSWLPLVLVGLILYFMLKKAGKNEVQQSKLLELEKRVSDLEKEK